MFNDLDALTSTGHDRLNAVHLGLVLIPALTDRLYSKRTSKVFNITNDLTGQIESKILSNVSAHRRKRMLKRAQWLCTDGKRLSKHIADASECIFQLRSALLHLIKPYVALHLIKDVEALCGVFEIHALLQTVKRIDRFLGMLLEILVVKVHCNQALFNFPCHETTSFQTSLAI